MNTFVLNFVLKGKDALLQTAKATGSHHFVSYEGLGLI